jgi:hypothetical protein
MFNIGSLEPVKSWGDVGGLAAVAGLIIALLAAGVALYHIEAGKRSQQETVARPTLATYLQLAIQYPLLADGHQPDDKLELARYEWFLAYMLNTCEQILLFLPKSSDWIEYIKTGLCYHKSYFAENEWFRKNYKTHYTSKLCSLIDQVCGIQK